MNENKDEIKQKPINNTIELNQSEKPQVELGFFCLQPKILSIIFDSCRDYAQQEMVN